MPTIEELNAITLKNSRDSSEAMSPDDIVSLVEEQETVKEELYIYGIRDKSEEPITLENMTDEELSIISNKMLAQYPVKGDDLKWMKAWEALLDKLGVSNSEDSSEAMSPDEMQEPTSMPPVQDL